MKKLSAMLEHVKLVFALLAMLGMAYLFTFYLDGDIGVVIWAFLLLTPLISVGLTLRARKHIRAGVEAPAYLARGRRFSADTVLTLEGSRLPVPFVRMTLGPSPELHDTDPRPVQTAMTAGEAVRIGHTVEAVHAGCASLGIEGLAVHDYLGLFRFAVTALPERVRIGVIPAIPSLTGAGVMLHTVSDIILTQDEEEEESSASFTAQSSPGYIHRDYTPGDNLRRINWKMSAKRKKLMVRMDEAVATVRPALVLDLSPETQEEALTRRDTMLEGALGMLLLLVQQGLPCSVRYASEGTWHTIILETEDAVRSAAVELAMADFVCGDSRFDRSALSERAGAYLVYTARPDAELAAAIAPARNAGYVMCVYPEGTDASALADADALWQLAADYSMTAVQK
ncbi:MAG: DUF58 domain-containing protein [Oscillospiraceae bacterium]|nr:DUF58 domain-containing protein [Oscillospiraceae bacterium]